MNNSRAYWRAIDAIASTVNERSTRGFRRGGGPGGVQGLRGWSTRMGVSLHPSVVPASQTVRVGPELWAEIGRLADLAAPAVSRAFDDSMPKLAFATLRQWPVLSGYSAALLTLWYEIRDQVFVGRFASLAEYTPFIQSGRALSSRSKTGRGNPWRSFVPRLERATVADIEASVERYLTAAAKGTPTPPGWNASAELAAALNGLHEARRAAAERQPAPGAEERRNRIAQERSRRRRQLSDAAARLEARRG